jgi:hypothetical protein
MNVYDTFVQKYTIAKIVTGNARPGTVLGKSPKEQTPIQAISACFF